MKDISEREYRQLIDTVKSVYGYDFSLYAQASMYRRLEKFLNSKNIEDVTHLVRRLELQPDLFKNFLEEITVNVTEMFRDPAFFKSIRSNVVPYLKTYPTVKIWDAGCSSGEEAYSLAILLHEEGLLNKTRIYATDINPKVIRTAANGIYPIDSIKYYSKNYLSAGGKFSLSDYYHAKYTNIVIHQNLAENILFSHHNLVSDGSFNVFNMVICRNVLIYFKRELQEQVLKLFLESLPVFGFLALGNKESLKFTAVESYFQVIDNREKIYQRIK